MTASAVRRDRGRPGGRRKAAAADLVADPVTVARGGAFAAAGATRAQVAATLHLLRWYRAFIRQTACELARDPESDWPPPAQRLMNREAARRRLQYLIDVAINRRAGVADVPTRKHEDSYQAALRRDRDRLDDIRRRLRVYQFETDRVRQRFAHLLADRND